LANELLDLAHQNKLRRWSFRRRDLFN